MKPILFIFLLISIIAKSQTKEDIIRQIIQINLLECEHRGFGILPDSTEMTESEKIERYSVPNKYDNYLNFQSLVKIISHQELVDLTLNKNGVIRMFAVRELIKQRDYTYNFYKFFLTEFKSKDRIEWQYGCFVQVQPVYEILLEDWSGNWNYARSTGSEKDSEFLDKILYPIDSFILVEKFNFFDAAYAGVFHRQKFNSTMNNRILELTYKKLNFWAFNYFIENNPVLFDSIKNEVIKKVIKKRKGLLKEHPEFFEGFLRYLVLSENFEKAKLMIQVVRKKEYSEERLEYMLMGIDKKLVDKVL